MCLAPGLSGTVNQVTQGACYRDPIYLGQPQTQRSVSDQSKSDQSKPLQLHRDTPGCRSCRRLHRRGRGNCSKFSQVQNNATGDDKHEVCKTTAATGDEINKCEDREAATPSDYKREPENCRLEE